MKEIKRHLYSQHTFTKEESFTWADRFSVEGLIRIHMFYHDDIFNRQNHFKEEGTIPHFHGREDWRI